MTNPSESPHAGTVLQKRYSGPSLINTNRARSGTPVLTELGFPVCWHPTSHVACRPTLLPRTACALSKGSTTALDCGWRRRTVGGIGSVGGACGRGRESARGWLWERCREAQLQQPRPLGASSLGSCSSAGQYGACGRRAGEGLHH